MATPAYMSITGTKQGLITAGAFTEDSVGNTYQEGHEDQVMVQGFNHEVIILVTRSPASRPASACTSRWSSPRSSTRPRRCCSPR
ncbi:Secreted protein hcp [Streptococcus dysgalactiae subsp. equisimilis]|nr:Secreted protein hcp [Streptococcus dysgalactiae subsp. equisimilis]